MIEFIFTHIWSHSTVTSSFLVSTSQASKPHSNYKFKFPIRLGKLSLIVIKFSVLYQHQKMISNFGYGILKTLLQFLVIYTIFLPVNLTKFKMKNLMLRHQCEFLFGKAKRILLMLIWFLEF